MKKKKTKTRVEELIRKALAINEVKITITANEVVKERNYMSTEPVHKTKTFKVYGVDFKTIVSMMRKGLQKNFGGVHGRSERAKV